MKLGNYIKQIRGVSYKPSDILNIPKEGYIPLLRANNIKDGKINFDNLVYVKKQKVKEEQLIKKNDILICTSSGSKELVGKAATFNSDIVCTFGAFCKVIRGFNINENYLSVFFQSNYYRKSVSKNSRGANINNLKQEDFDNIIVNIPEEEEQIYIARKFNKIFKIISLRKEQINKLDELIKSQFVEMFGNPLTSNNYGRIKLEEITKVRQGLQIPIAKRKTESGENRYKYITIQYLHGRKETEYIENPNERVICDEDDILMTRTGNTGQVITNVTGVFHNNFFLVDFDRNKINKTYFIKYFQDDGIYKDMLQRATTSTIPDLSHGEFYKMTIDLPPIELQNKFAQIVEQIDKQKFKFEKSLKKLEELQSSLMQEYFG